MLFAPGTAITQALSSPRRKREIGVIYAPATELQSHYSTTKLSEQFDAVVNVDRTRALTLLE
jgi:erythromycin esterase-like protein